MNPSQSVLIARIATLSLLAFFIIGSYGIARPCIDSLFLKHYSAATLPYVWIATALGMAVTLWIYNHFNQRHSLLKIFGVACIVSGVFLVFCLLFYREGFEESLFVLNIWKEIYVVVLIEIFWSFADIVFSIRNARLIYGVLLAVGSFGGLIGNMSIGSLASLLGTENAIWLVLILLFLCWLVSIIFAKSASEFIESKKAIKKVHWFESFHVVRSSRYLLPLLFLIGIIQIATTAIDYEFNSIIESSYPDVDARTAMFGKIHYIVDSIAIGLQLLTAPVLLLFGVSKTLVAIPICIGAAVISFIVSPQLLTIVITKITSKCFDYSIFRAAKEILYIPLNHAEKTQGKALIDILVYRIAKGVASLLILALIYLQLRDYLMPLTAVFLLMWFVLTYIIVKRYRSLVSVEQELIGETPCKTQTEN